MARADGFPETLSDFEVVGTLTRSVADAVLLDDVLSGPDARDRRSLIRLGQADGAPTPLRILYVPRFDDAPLDREVEAATDEAARWLSGQGHKVEAGPLFFDRAVVDDIWRVVGRAGAARVFQQTEGRLQREGGAFIQAAAKEGMTLSAVDYVEALSRVTAFRREIDEAFERFDLVLMPSAAALPWPAEDPFPPVIDGRQVGPRGHAIYTGWVNAAGNPAIALPLGLSATGLPIGAQFIGRFGADEALLAFARRFEGDRRLPYLWPRFAEGA